LITADLVGHFVVLEHISGRPGGTISWHLKVIFLTASGDIIGYKVN